MGYSFIEMVIGSILGLAFLVGIYILQVFLSKKEVRWAGFILPLVTVIVSIFAFFAGIGPNGFKSSIAMLGMINVGTLIHILIYYGVNNKKVRNTQINKMNIQDLG